MNDVAEAYEVWRAAAVDRGYFYPPWELLAPDAQEHVRDAYDRGGAGVSLRPRALLAAPRRQPA